jgi:hypothetical protein
MQASQSAANKGTSQNWNNKRGRLLAWIRDQVRLKALLTNWGPYIQEEAQPCAIQRTIGKRETIRSDTIAALNNSQRQ